MATFKILPDKGEKVVFVKGKFSDYLDYSKLKNEIIKSSQTLEKKYKIRDNENFKLLLEDTKEKLYFPPQLTEGIGNIKSYSYFLERIFLRGIQKSYKFYVQKIKRAFVWKEPEKDKNMIECIEKSWKPIQDQILKDLGSGELEESQSDYNDKKNELLENEKNINKEEHKNIVCNNCFKSNIKGKRFICAECNNYNLCQNCEKQNYKTQIHNREHTLVQLNKALNDEESYNYNNILGNDKLSFLNVPTSFPIEITVVNCGEEDLENCYFSPVRFGEKYLSCIPKKITESVTRNMPTSLYLIVRLPEKKGYFEGYFRMFTPSGLPFGKTLHVEVINGE